MVRCPSQDAFPASSAPGGPLGNAAYTLHVLHAGEQEYSTISAAETLYELLLEAGCVP